MAPTDLFQNENAGRTFEEELKRDSRKTALLTALRAAPLRAIRKREHVETIRQIPRWHAILTLVQKGYPRPVAERIADILAATLFWRESLIPLVAVTVPVQNGNAPTQIGESGFPFGSYDVLKAFRRERKDHQKFVRQGAKLLKSLESFHPNLEEYDQRSLGTPGYGDVLRACDQLISSIRARAQIEPSLHGSQLSTPEETEPHNIAARMIYDLLLRNGRKKWEALGCCYESLGTVFPNQFPVTDDVPNTEGLYQRILRTRRKYKMSK